jgi:23S rRNA pseudouridine2457 synthase
MLIAFNKPFRVMSQFSPSGDKKTLADYIQIPKIYPAGRLDFDSEGLLLLTDDGKLQHRISDPKHKQVKTYWAQVEGIPDAAALQKLRDGVQLKDGITRPAEATLINEPESLWLRDPPIRQRANIPTRWIELSITEGRNRQVRRMTAAVGFPTLRLIRATIGAWSVMGLAVGTYCSLD